MAIKYLKYDLQLFAEDNKDTGLDDSDQTGGDGSINTTGDGTTDEETTGTKGDSGKSEKTFSQRQVTAMMTKEKKQGRNAAYAELGIDPSNAKQVAMVKALIDSQKTDEQKLNEEAAANAAKIAEAEHRAAVAEAKAEAMKLGAKSQFVDDIVALAMTKVDDNTDIESVIGDLKTKYEMWFGEEDSEEKKTGQKGTGSSVGSGTSGTGAKGGEQNLGTRLAASRRQANVGGKERKSFWA